MAERALPGLGLKGFYTLGAHTWKPGMDENMRILSVIGDGRVKSRTAALPATPTIGDVYIVPSGDATNPNKVAVWDGEAGSEAWVYYAPKQGWAFYVLDESKNYQYDGAAWIEFAAGGGGSAVSVNEKTAAHTYELADAGDFVDLNSASAATFTIPTDATVNFPLGTIISGGQVGPGVLTVTAAAGVVLNGVDGGSKAITAQWGEYSIRKRAANSWFISGAI